MMSLEGTNSKRSPWRRLCLATSPLPPDSTLSNSSFCFAKPSVLSHSFSNVPFSRDRGSQPQSTPVLFLIPSHHNQHHHRHHPHRHDHHQRWRRQQIPRRKRKKVLRITPDILNITVNAEKPQRFSQRQFCLQEENKILPSGRWKNGEKDRVCELQTSVESFFGTCHDALFAAAAAVVARRRKFQLADELWGGREWRSMDAA